VCDGHHSSSSTWRHSAVPIVTTRVVGLAGVELDINVVDTLPVVVVVVVVVCATACSTSARRRFANGGAFSLPVLSRPATALAMAAEASQGPQAQMVAVAGVPAESTGTVFQIWSPVHICFFCLARVCNASTEIGSGFPTTPRAFSCGEMQG
jgi:hypothetical protein